MPGKGQPLDLKENPFEDPDLRMVHKLLRDAGFAPAWIEERKDIEATFAHARETLARAMLFISRAASLQMMQPG